MAVDVWQRTFKEAGLFAALSRHSSLLLLVHLRTVSQSEKPRQRWYINSRHGGVEQGGLATTTVAIPKAGMLLLDDSLRHACKASMA